MIPDLSMRAMALADAPALAALETVASGLEVDVASMRDVLTLPGFNAALDGCIADDNRGLAGSARVLARHGVANIVWTLRHDAHGRGVLEALLRWGVERSRENAGIGEVNTFVDASWKQAVDAIEDLGFKHLKSNLTMSRSLASLPEPKWPEGIQPDRLPTNEVARVADAIFRESFGDQPDYEPRSLESWEEEVGATDTDLWLFAHHGRRTVGFTVSAFLPPGNVGEIGPIGTAPAYRGRGIGRALLRLAMRELRGRGAETVRLIVNSANPTAASHLYRSEGFEVTRDWRTYRRST